MTSYGFCEMTEKTPLIKKLFLLSLQDKIEDIYIIDVFYYVYGSVFGYDKNTNKWIMKNSGREIKESEILFLILNNISRPYYDYITMGKNQIAITENYDYKKYEKIKKKTKKLLCNSYIKRLIKQSYEMFNLDM